MSTLITIGNSQGIRIPKPIIKQANLADKELEFVVVQDGLLIKPIKDPNRETWEENIKILMSNDVRDEAVIESMLDDSDLEDVQW